jgi:hypothetical protein
MSQVRVILSKLGMLRFWEAALEGRLSTLKQKGLQFYHPADPFHLAHPSNTHTAHDRTDQEVMSQQTTLALA